MISGSKHFLVESDGFINIIVRDLSAWVGFAHQAHSRVSNITFDIWILLGGTLFKSHEKLPTDGKVLSHLGFKSKVCPGP